MKIVSCINVVITWHFQLRFLWCFFKYILIDTDTLKKVCCIEVTSASDSQIISKKHRPCSWKEFRLQPCRWTVIESSCELCKNSQLMEKKSKSELLLMSSFEQLVRLTESWSSFHHSQMFNVVKFFCQFFYFTVHVSWTFLCVFKIANLSILYILVLCDRPT